VLIIFCCIVHWLMCCGLWCLVYLGDAMPCAGSLGWLAGSFWGSSEYGNLEDGSSLCDVVYLEGEECLSL
jgi:hypothetical protein